MLMPSKCRLLADIFLLTLRMSSASVFGLHPSPWREGTALKECTDELQVATKAISVVSFALGLSLGTVDASCMFYLGWDGISGTKTLISSH